MMPTGSRLPANVSAAWLFRGTFVRSDLPAAIRSAIDLGLASSVSPKGERRRRPSATRLTGLLMERFADTFLPPRALWLRCGGWRGSHRSSLSEPEPNADHDREGQARAVVVDL